MKVKGRGLSHEEELNIPHIVPNWIYSIPWEPKNLNFPVPASQDAIWLSIHGKPYVLET